MDCGKLARRANQLESGSIRRTRGDCPSVGFGLDSGHDTLQLVGNERRGESSTVECEGVDDAERDEFPGGAFVSDALQV